LCYTVAGIYALDAWSDRIVLLLQRRACAAGSRSHRSRTSVARTASVVAAVPRSRRRTTSVARTASVVTVEEDCRGIRDAPVIIPELNVVRRRRWAARPVPRGHVAQTPQGRNNSQNTPPLTFVAPGSGISSSFHKLNAFFYKVVPLRADDLVHNALDSLFITTVENEGRKSTSCCHFIPNFVHVGHGFTLAPAAVSKRQGALQAARHGLRQTSYVQRNHTVGCTIWPMSN